MNTKKEIKEKVRHYLAVSEVWENTPKVQKCRETIIRRQGSDCNIDIILYRDVAASYSGQTTPESVGVKNFCRNMAVHMPQYRKVFYKDNQTINEIVELYWKEEQKHSIVKVRLHEFWELVAKAFAKAEIEQDTPKARYFMAPYLKESVCDSLGTEDLDLIADEISLHYTGQGKAGARLQAAIFKKFQGYIRAEYDVLIETEDTLQQAVTKVYEAARKARIEKIRTELAEWEISPKDLFPEESYYGH